LNQAKDNIGSSSFLLAIKNILGRINDLITHRNFPWIFSLVYALINVLSFYPGILYSDSGVRWQLAICFAENNWINYCTDLHSSHHPVIPSMVMSLFYSLTKEVGLFIFVQCFLLSFSLFYLTNTIQKSKASNLLCAALLLLPIHTAYAIFHSFDSFFAVLSAFFVALLIKLFRGKENAVYPLAVLFFCLVSWRLNSIALLPFALVFIIYILLRQKRKKIFIGFRDLHTI